MAATTEHSAVLISRDDKIRAHLAAVTVWCRVALRLAFGSARFSIGHGCMIEVDESVYRGGMTWMVSTPCNPFSL